jgi:TRAP-type mannitol/chloroaromatic compound transport system permease large subunit
MGALGSIVVVALAGRFSFSVLRETVLATTRITAGMMFILICAPIGSWIASTPRAAAHSGSDATPW